MLVSVKAIINSSVNHRQNGHKIIQNIKAIPIDLNSLLVPSESIVRQMEKAQQRNGGAFSCTLNLCILFYMRLYFLCKVLI